MIFAYKKVGGLHWLYAGRLCVALCLKRKVRRGVVEPRTCHDFSAGPLVSAQPRVRSVVIEGRRVFAVQ